ncbi:MAG: K(+)-transporting ATPase subunit F [Bryobacteraceae bacterium]
MSLLGTLSKQLFEDIAMEYIIGGVTTLFLFIYLLYALLRPEKF